jgi:malonate transporter and related proteins
MLFSVLIVTVPVFALVFCGFAGHQWKILPDQAVAGINAFVFNFALPAMLFRVVVSNPLSTVLRLDVALAWISAGLCVYALTWYLARTRSKKHRLLPVTYAANATHGNVGYLGLALIAEVAGPQALPTVALTIICDIAVFIALTIALFEYRTLRDPLPWYRLLGKVFSGLIKSPLVLSIAAGLIWNLTELPLPKILDNFTRLLGAAAGPCALFAIGASLGKEPLIFDEDVASLLAIKLMLHPLLVSVAMINIWAVPAEIVPIAVLCAALPAASNTYILAQRYGAPTRGINSAIVIGTFVAVITVSAVLALSNIVPRL